MAREEHAREDLMREATALTRRIEFSSRNSDETIVCGFRSNGAVSFFLGEDPVYQFNVDCELRRAYRGGKLLKAENGHLIELTRRREANVVHLMRRQLSDAETSEFLEQMEKVLSTLEEGIKSNSLRTIQQVPPQGNLTETLLIWFQQRPSGTAIARTANV